MPDRPNQGPPGSAPQQDPRRRGAAAVSFKRRRLCRREWIQRCGRVAELQEAILLAQRVGIIMGVGLAEDANGVQLPLIGTSEPMGQPPAWYNAQIKRNSCSQSGGHAEPARGQHLSVIKGALLKVRIFSAELGNFAKKIVISGV